MIAQRAAKEDPDSYNDSLTAKAVAMAILCIASLTFGLLPIKLQKWFHWDRNPKASVWVSMLLALGGGVLLCTTFLHLLPEVSEKISDLQESSDLPKMTIELAELLMCVGFFLMYFVEEVVHGYIERRNKKNEMDKVILLLYFIPL